MAACLMIGMGTPRVAAAVTDPAPAASYPHKSNAPRGAPNILVIMTDDTGFGASSAFGGPIPTPTMEALAARGLRYNQFNTTSMCSPTRAALLTGRNAHSVGFGVISEEASPDPGYNSVIPKSAATFAQVLSMNGYDTAMLGKHHNAPLWEDTPIGPFDHWPNALGFGYFYGFLGGATNQFAPSLMENRNWKEAAQDDPTYILDKDLADHAIDWLHMQHSVHPQAPFLMYYAPGSAHSPNQAPADWIARFRGKFDQGWDRMREETFARQKKGGIIPANAALTPRAKEIPAWASLRSDQRRVEARMMEVYAGQLAYLDHELGRVIDALKESGEFDNTLILFIEGDNGGSLEGSPTGTVDEIAHNKNHMPETLADQIEKLNDFGTRYSWNNYPVGWAWAMNTPFQWGKAIASHLGGIRNGLIVSWPGHLKGEGQVRSQFTHVTDIAPTLYEVAGVTPPAEVAGVKQMPLAGVSFAYSFTQADAPSRHNEQYFELRENIGYYKDGWLASTEPRVMPWDKEAPPTSGTPVNWDLYNLREDYSQSRNVAARYPAKLVELQADFKIAAQQFQIQKLPEASPAPARPFISNGQKHFVYYNSDWRISRYAFANIMNKSWSASAQIVVPAQGGDGALVAQGSRLNGWSLVILKGRPTFFYNASIADRDKTRLTADSPLSPGPHEVAVDFAYDGGGVGKGGTATLLVDGKQVAQGRVPRTFGGLLVSEGGSTIGRDYGTTLSDDYAAPFIYPGTIKTVTIDLK
jgi:arylsulfatase